MITKIIIAGFGGQGIILSGKLLAYSAMLEGKEVSHFPAYGAEMRGGTCNCSVIISDKPIASPVVNYPDIALALNQPSKLKFEPKCIKNGKIIINSSLIEDKANRNDIEAYYVDATNIAEKLGSTKAANMVMLGAFLKITDLVKLDTMINALSDVISARNRTLLEINSNAIKEGYDIMISCNHTL